MSSGEEAAAAAAAAYCGNGRGYEVDKETGVVVLLSDDEDACSSAASRPTQNCRTTLDSKSSAERTLVSPPRFHLQAKSVAQDVLPKGSKPPFVPGIESKQRARKPYHPSVVRPPPAAHGTSTSTPTLRDASTLGQKWSMASSRAKSSGTTKKRGISSNGKSSHGKKVR